MARKGKGKEARKRMPLSVRALGKIVAATEMVEMEMVEILI